MNKNPLLQVNNLSCYLASSSGFVRAVDGVSFSLAAGETLALLGESGCGKSMTALSIAQLLPDSAYFSTASVINFAGEDLLQLSAAKMREIRAKKIAMIFQEPMTALNAVMTIEAQLAEAFFFSSGEAKINSHQRCLALLQQVGINEPEQRLKQYPHELSGGMKQRVMIAMALASEAELLIADEPTTALDVTIQAEILALLRQCQQERGMALLLITHDLGVVAQMADKIGVMYAGHLLEYADKQSFFTQPRHPYSQQLFAAKPDSTKRQQQLAVIPGQVPPLNKILPPCRFVDRCQVAEAICQQQAPDWQNLNMTHQARCHFVEKIPKEVSAVLNPVIAKEKTPTEQAVLTVSNLKVHFPIKKGIFKRTVASIKAVDGLSLQLNAGKTLALVGESGCGKTTAGKGIMRLLPSAINEGEVYLNDIALHTLSELQCFSYRKEMQIIFQDPYASLNPRLMVEDIIAEGLSAQKMLLHPKNRAIYIAELLERVGLSADQAQRYPHEFSGGQRQRLAIARALAVQPKVLICDEPTSALDVSVQAKILNLLQELKNELNLAYLFISHDISVVSYLADEIAVMYLGRIIERGRTVDILNNPQHPYTQNLLAAVPKIEPDSLPPQASLAGELPSPKNPPAGCHFCPRCPKALTVCRSEYPSPRFIAAGHEVSCHLLS